MIAENVFFLYYGWCSDCICGFWQILKAAEANFGEESLFFVGNLELNRIFTFHSQDRLIVALKRPTSRTVL